MVSITSIAINQTQVSPSKTSIAGSSDSDTSATSTAGAQPVWLDKTQRDFAYSYRV